MIKALVVGINNYKFFPEQALHGCLNDAQDVMSYLTDVHQVAHDDIVPLFDERATKVAIVTALKDMVRSLRPGDHMLFHYSGHGTQLLSSAITEPDGLDEAICPYDFEFQDRSSALTDKELAVIVASTPPGSLLTVVVDACHSGDVSRALDAKRMGRARFLRPPFDYAWRLRGRKGGALRDLAPSNVVTISACRSDETAADTSFDGRPNGAFTYSWLSCLKAGPTHSLDVLVTDVASPLASFSMHPQIDGAAAVRAETFLHDPPTIVRALTSRAAPRATRAMSVLLDRTWSSSVFGLDMSVELRILLRGAGLEFVLSANAPLPLSFSFPVDGNLREDFDLALGFKLVTTVSDWTTGPGTVTFALNIAIQPPFFGAVTVAREPITLVLPAMDRALAAPTSPADFLAMMQLAQLGGSKTPMLPTRDIVTGDVPIVVAQGDEGWGPNWREDRLVRVGFFDHGKVRDNVSLGPQQGQGNVYFVRWVSDDPTNGDFILHIGNNFFGGFGSIHWVINGFYADVNGFPREARPAPPSGVRRPLAEFTRTSATNGASKHKLAEV